MKTLYTLLLITLVTFASQAQVIEHTYDFNDLVTGSELGGQDDWTTILYTGGPGDLMVDITSGVYFSGDGTNSLWYPYSGGNYGRGAARKATANFDFDLTIEGVLEVEFDMRRSHWGNFFGVGFDADEDGNIAPGLESEPDDGGIHINIAGFDVNENFIVLPNDEQVIFTSNNSAWARYKMILDYEANDGEGAVSLFVMPGTQGEWEAAPEIQGLNMGLTPGSGDKRDHEVWDGVYYRSPGYSASLDNILIREPEDNGQLQFIAFEAIPNMLATSPPFELIATASSGLPVEFEIIEGPITINGNTVTLTGEGGMVTILASQPGNDIWAPAVPVSQSFEIVDATAYTPDLTIRRPANSTNVYMPELSSIIIVASAYIEHTEVLSIEQVTYSIEGSGENMTEKSWGTGYYSSEWTPPAYGTYSMTITAISTGDMVSTETITFEVVDNPTDFNVHAFDHVHISASQTQSVTLDVVFPTYVGSFNDVMTYFNVTCPPLGCDPWDRIGTLKARGPNGEWVEIIRYVTPYGVACNHELDVTDYASLFQGKVEMKLSIGTSNDGFVVDVVLDFKEGTPEYKYSWVSPIWSSWYNFGDYANLQPVDTILWNFEETVEASKLKVVNTGHGWGDANTGNAAEFYNATHHIKINDDSFPQHLWVDCNPNPDGCQPQNGTWYYNRAGWCPGSIGYVFEYDLTPYVNLPDVQMVYEFFPGYVDYCHPNHPDCVTGVTCWDCEQGFNPAYMIEGNLISYSNSLYIPVGEKENNYFGLQLSPNPAVNFVQLSTNRKNASLNASVQIFNTSGQLLQHFRWNGETRSVDVSEFAEGVYIVSVQSGKEIEIKKLVIQ